ncbi:MAG TPA: hypothetical protein VFF65_12285 [Phycisphaerales bacterium]|nr:hypothetical protein [Phycisphaerales bacterium]
MLRTRLSNLITRTKVHATVTVREPHKVDPHRKQVCYSRPGKVGTALLLWLIGIPLPLILLFFLIKGCVS